MSDIRLPLGPAPIVPDEESVISRILAHVEAKTTDKCPATHVESTDIYVDAARLAREKEAVFRRTPTLIASSAELRGEDAYLARMFLGTPFLIVRDEPGGLHAMLNACRHRGSPVASDGAGCAKAFVCPY